MRPINAYKCVASFLVSLPHTKKTMAKYSNARAMRALIKASLQAIFKSPSAIVFSIAFPLIFILVFGFLGNSRGYSIHVATAPGCDTNNMVYGVLQQIPVLKWTKGKDSAAVNKDLAEGDIAATIKIEKQAEGVSPQYKILLNSVSGQEDKLRQLQAILREVLERQ